MNSVSYIESTRDYDKFQMHPENRCISAAHIRRFVFDKSFPENFNSCPMTVSDDGYIIDGQHRYEAAKRLKIPLHYITISGKDVQEQIRIRNMKMLKWSSSDIVKFYKTKKDSYRILYEMSTKFGVSYSFLKSVIVRMARYGSTQYTILFKEGNLSIADRREDIFNFLNSYVLGIKTIRAMRPGEFTMPLFYDVFIQGAVHLFQKKRNVYDKFMENLAKVPDNIRHAKSFEGAVQTLEDVSTFRRRKGGLDDLGTCRKRKLGTGKKLNEEMLED